jgi:hypothetical protein
MSKTISTITIEIDSKWAWLARSPLYFIVSALTGVSVTFAPLFLYWSGKGRFYPGYERTIVPLCFAVIFLVPSFYFAVGTAVVKKLRNSN